MHKIVAKNSKTQEKHDERSYFHRLSTKAEF
jgi:hypothetical protein